MSEFPSVLLNNGNKMPVIGMGTFAPGAAPGAAGDAIERALTVAGYTHIDCALVYANEEEIGQSLEKVFKEGKVKREDVFITSKLWSTFLHRDRVRKAFNQTLADLRSKYLDLYLIHWPVALAESEDLFLPDIMLTDDDYLDSWKEMEKLVDEGLVKSIGISNFSSKQVQRLLDNCRIKPAVLQVECHVFLNNQPLIEFCFERGISVTAYGIFGMPANHWLKGTEPRPLLCPKVKALATKYNKSPAQVLLRHAFQRNLVAIAKSWNTQRMKENLEIFDFELSPDDMATLNGINTDTRMCPGFATWHASRYFPWPADDEEKL